MKEEDRDKLEDWLSDQQFDNQYGDDVNSPRDWLREAVKTSLHDCKRPMGYSNWAYELAITMVPTYPDIVLDYKEYGEGDVEFTFDWKRFNSILDGALDTLINQSIEDT